jgi:5-methylcytosine-specific restriction endonuclease McrA
MNVDHIKPRHKYPHLAMDESNLQVLCATCNAGKGGRDETDWREGISIEKALDIVYLVDLRERGLLH